MVAGCAFVLCRYVALKGMDILANSQFAMRNRISDASVSSEQHERENGWPPSFGTLALRNGALDQIVFCASAFDGLHVHDANLRV